MKSPGTVQERLTRSVQMLNCLSCGGTTGLYRQHPAQMALTVKTPELVRQGDVRGPPGLLEAGEATAPWWAVAKEQAQPFLQTGDKQQPDPLTKNRLTDAANIRNTVLGSVCHVSYTLLRTFFPMETLSSFS